MINRNKLEKENKLLKETKLANQFPNTHCIQVKINTYKDRIDKAIEYIERNCLEFNVKYACQGLNNDKVDVLLDILRGEDND